MRLDLAAVLQILEELNIGWEHMPTGIDDLSIILRSRQLTPIKEEEILRQLVQKASRSCRNRTRPFYHYDCW